MDFIFDPNLVLYLPFYELDGASFISRDAYGHLGTVTGALWRPDGRWFDHLDDIITIPAHSSLNLGDKSFTIWGWINPDGQGTAGRHPLISKHHAIAAGQSLYIQQEGTTKVGFGFYSDDLEATGTYPYNTWRFILVTYRASDKARRIDVDGNVAASDTAGGNMSTLTDDDNFLIGRVGYTARFHGGLIGEVGMVSSYLSPLEGQLIYHRTKWRYQ